MSLPAGLPSGPVSASNPLLLRGIVKQVNSGDSVVIRGPPRNGPPLERSLNFSNITAPRLARRPGQNSKAEDSKDEPFAWEAREFLRKKLVGKEVVFVVEYKVPATGREYGVLWLGKDMETGLNMTEAIVAEGLVSVRRESKSDISRLLEIEEAAKMAQRGKWGQENEKHVREVLWTVENAQALLSKVGRKPVSAVVEHVRDGSTVRLFLLPSFQYVTVMMSGIRTPGFKLDAEGEAATEAYAEQARYFTESRLLQQNVDVILESVNGQNFIGSIIHPNGNIAELLLLEGFGRCIDWSMGFVTGGAEKLRAAEKFAKEKKLRLWANYTEGMNHLALAGIQGKDREFVATVVEFVNADALVLKLQDGTLKKIFLASIRPPRLEGEKREGGAGDGAPPAARPANFRPLYDIPFMFEAREYLRKKMIGKKVHVTVDYIQPAANAFPEKVCCTVKSDGLNVGEVLLSKGLATVVRYGQNDDRRASDYDLLLAAEAKAQKGQKGIYGKKDLGTSMQHVVDITGDTVKAKQFLPFFKRAGRTSGVVEFVASGSRLRIFVPREMRVITFLLAGISCPKADRAVPKSTEVVPGDPFGNEAKAFTKELTLQREVEIEVEDIDKAGNFIGWLWIDGKNLSLGLVEEGFASVHFSAEKSSHFRSLKIAEDGAKARRENIWLHYVELVEEGKGEEDKEERKVDFKHVLVTEVGTELKVWVQFTSDGDKLESLTNEFRRQLTENPPLSGAYTPRKDAICVARYSQDGEWYRAKVEKELADRKVAVLFIDYGNREVVPAAKCAALPAVPGASAPGYAKEYTLACLTLPTDEDYAADAIAVLKQETSEGKFQLNVEYKLGNTEYVTLVNERTKEDIGEILVKEGLVLVENRKERRLQKLLKEYKAAEKEAKTQHRNVWEYGDITEDDAREFGMSTR